MILRLRSQSTKLLPSSFSLAFSRNALKFRGATARAIYNQNLQRHFRLLFMISELLPNQINYNSHSNWHPSGHSSVTWSKFTNPIPIITWEEVVSMVNINMLIISTIWLMLDLSVLRVPRPCLYMLGSSSQPKCIACVPRPCLYMLGSSTPVVFER